MINVKQAEINLYDAKKNVLMRMAVYIGVR